MIEPTSSDTRCYTVGFMNNQCSQAIDGEAKAKLNLLDLAFVTVAIIVNVSLGSPLDLLLTVDGFDDRYNSGEQFQATKSLSSGAFCYNAGAN